VGVTPTRRVRAPRRKRSFVGLGHGKGSILHRNREDGPIPMPWERQGFLKNVKEAREIGGRAAHPGNRQSGNGFLAQRGRSDIARGEGRQAIFMVKKGGGRQEKDRWVSCSWIKSREMRMERLRLANDKSAKI